MALSRPKTCTRGVLIICLIMYLLITALISKKGEIKPELREEIWPLQPSGRFNYEGNLIIWVDLTDIMINLLMLTIYHKWPRPLTCLPFHQNQWSYHNICMILVTSADTDTIFGLLWEKRTAKTTLVIFAIIAAAILLSPSVAGCPSHFTFEFVE